MKIFGDTGLNNPRLATGRCGLQLLLALAGVLVSGFWVSGSSQSAVTLTAQRGTQAVAEVLDQTVQYSSGGVNIEAYVAKPAGTGSHPAVIVVHDDQGLNENIRETTRLFATEGFVAFAPNLVSRLAGMSQRSEVEGRGQASRLRQLSTSQTAIDIRAAFSYLQQDPSVDAAKISVVGFGWGGWRAFKLAEEESTLHRAVVFYGTTSHDEQLPRIRASILGHYAEYDFQTTGNVLATKRRLGNRFTYYIYPDTDRGFWGGSSGAIDYTALIRGRQPETEPRTGGDNREANVGQAAASQAWERTLAFLRATN